MICPTCQRDTAPITIGHTDYCNVCGNAYRQESQPAAAGPAPAKRMDMGPRRPAAAGALHQRASGQGVIDLRPNPAPAAPAEPPAVKLPERHGPAPAPHTAAHERHAAHYTDRINAARSVVRSPHINRFSGGQTAPARLDLAQPTPQPPAPPPTPTPAPAPAAQELPPAAATQHEAMTQLARPVTPPPSSEPLPKPTKPGWRPHLKLAANPSRVLTTAAAVLIMGSYIWLHNYPKLALQTANSQAGISATLPGYLPSSYNLASTKTSTGLVTLSFKSPAINDTLQIEQHRTSWDSQSLLDNVVAKQADDYSTVHGQGLTIYLFGQNQAAWVNHGIRYSITGATHLSREQILKIAYSL